MSALQECDLDVTVLILGGGRGTRLAPLTQRRSKPAVPVAGKYRLIDIPLSNAINSGMERMYVLTQFNSVSLHRHIGRTYRFDAFSRGYVQILAAQQTPTVQTWFQGTADAVRHNLHIFAQLPGEHVLILAGDHMYRMDYRQLLHDHIENDADITIGVMPCSEAEIAGFGAARVDEDGRILEFRAKPKTAVEREGMEVAPELLAEAVYGLGHDSVEDGHRIFHHLRMPGQIGVGIEKHQSADTRDQQRKGQRQEPAADDLLFVSELNGWLPFAAASGVRLTWASYSCQHRAAKTWQNTKKTLINKANNAL